jgi:two-component system, OmpR family, alkaline phosphatase synthesis response regulator PhoP
MNASILLIEDEPGLQLTLRDLLGTEGHDVQTAGDGELGLSMALSGDFDLILLDVMLPKKSGFDVCRELRGQGIDTPTLMLTARTMVSDRVTGLKLGADDYLAKPFDPTELLARVEALLRRVHKEKRIPLSKLRFGQVIADFDRSEVVRNGRVVNLSAKEFKLLHYLVERRGTVVSREDILRDVWSYSSEASSRTIDVHIAWLRQKIEENTHHPKHIHTIRGKGYRFLT